MGDNTVKRPILTYAEDGQYWNYIEAEFVKRLPISGMCWDAAGRSKSIPPLEMDIQKFSSDLFPKTAPGVQHNVYFIHLFLVGCDDVDSYRSTSRKAIQDWLNVINTKKVSEWIIVYVSPEGKTSKGIFNIGAQTSVYDKLKSDFNQQKRCFQIKLSSADTDSWNDLFKRVTDCVLGSFTTQVALYEDDVRRLESQRMTPGWNYCQFFLLKETLIFTFELVGMYSEALVHYDELEAVFYQTMKEQGIPWFKKFGGNQLKDDSRDLKEYGKLSYRQAIIESCIPIFDFRLYLFSRQLQLLKKLGDPVEICVRTKLFLASFSMLLESNTNPIFRQVWIFSACMHIIRHCDEIVAVSSLSQQFRTYEVLKSEILIVAKMQLDRLGGLFGLLDNALLQPKDSRNLSAEELHEGKGMITNTVLQHALESNEAFDGLYEAITTKAIRGFEVGGRSRIVNALKSDLAFLSYTRGAYSKAAAVWSEVCFTYSETHWFELDSQGIKMLAECYRKMGDSKGLFDCLLHLTAFPGYSQAADGDAKELLQLLNTYSADVMVRREARLLAFQGFTRLDAPHSDTELIVARIRLFSSLALPMAVDMVELQLSAGNGMDLKCSAGDISIATGTNDITLLSHASYMPGRYTPITLRVFVGRVVFEYDVSHDEGQRHLQILPSDASPSFQVKLLEECGADTRKTISFKVISGKIALPATQMVISPLTSISFKFPDHINVKSNGHGLQPFDALIREKRILLPAMQEGEEFDIHIEYDVSNTTSLDHKVQVALINEVGKQILSSVVRFKLDLPFTANHVVLRNSSATILQFQLDSKVSKPVRIVTTSIDSVIPVQTISAPAGDLFFTSQRFTVIGTVPLKQSQGATRVSLVVKYRHVTDEIKRFVLGTIGKHLKAAKLDRYTEFLKNMYHKHSLQHFDATFFAVHGTMKISPFTLGPEWEASFEKTDPLQAETKAALERTITTVNKDLELVTADGLADTFSDLDCHTLIYRAQLPECQLLLEIQWVIDPSAKLLVGHIIPCAILVKSQQWALQQDAAEMEYNVELAGSNFTFDGLKRRCFNVAKGRDCTFKVNLVPLSAGHLILPAIQLKPKDNTAEICVNHLTSGRAILVMPREQSSTHSFAVEERVEGEAK